LPTWLEPRRRADKAFYAEVMEAYTGGISTRKVDALVEALGGACGISKSEVSRICQGLDEQVKAFLCRPLDHARYPYVFLDATYLHGRLGQNMQVVSRAVVVAIGINDLGYREVLGIAVGDSEAEGFWRQFLGSLKERGLTGTRLVISDAHLGLTAAIRRMFQGSSWQRCRVHFLRNLLSHVPKAGQDMVAAAMKAVFVIQAPEQVRSHWQRVTEMLRKQFPTAVPVMDAARDDVLAFLHVPQEHWRKIWSTNPLERLNKEIKRRTNVVGIFPNDPAIVRLVGSQLLEQQEDWQLERRRFFSEATMAKIPEPEEALELTDADPSAQPAASTS
jgi:putative transposase